MQLLSARMGAPRRLVALGLILSLAVMAIGASAASAASAKNGTTPKTAYGEMFSISPTSGVAGTVVTLTGTGWYATGEVTIDFDNVAVASPTLADGAFSASYTIPDGTAAGAHTFLASGPAGPMGQTDFATAMFMDDAPTAVPTNTPVPLGTPVPAQDETITGTLSYLSGPDPLVLGSTTKFAYEVTVTNFGADTLNATTISIELPAETMVVASSLGTGTQAASIVTWVAGTLGQGQSTTYTIDVTFTPSADNPYTGATDAGTDPVIVINTTGTATDASNGDTVTASPQGAITASEGTTVGTGPVPTATPSPMPGTGGGSPIPTTAIFGSALILLAAGVAMRRRSFGR
jgi:hypothetical protein